MKEPAPLPALQLVTPAALAQYEPSVQDFREVRRGPGATSTFVVYRQILQPDPSTIGVQVPAGGFAGQLPHQEHHPAGTHHQDCRAPQVRSLSLKLASLLLPNENWLLLTHRDWLCSGRCQASP